MAAAGRTGEALEAARSAAYRRGRSAGSGVGSHERGAEDEKGAPRSSHPHQEPAHTGTTGTVDWDNSWTGTAYITVRGVNACDSGIWSDTLAVVILSNPSVSFSGATLSGLESISPVQFIATLSFSVPVDVSFDYTTADGTAINGAGNDYATASGNTTISAGETTDTILVTVYEDATEEPNETFTFTLSGFANSTAGTDTVITYTILDNDGLGWVGPGGVGNLSDQMNVWHNTYYSGNLSDGQKVSTNPNQWDDLSTNDVDEYQGNASNQPTFYDVAPVWNGRPVIQFNISNSRRGFKRC